MIPAVIYAAKSTEDKHGSIGTQIADCRNLAEREGWEVIGEFSDEGFSAYSGNRGPDLERAKQAAIAAAAEHGECILVAQDADRFARGAGDAPDAADHLGELYFAMKRQGVELWTVRSGHLDLLRAAIEGERSRDESARKTQSVRAGLKRRKDRGQPVGPVLLGYRVERTVVENTVITSRVEDPEYSAVMERAFKLIDQGHTPGEICRIFNREGLRNRPRGGKPGQPFAARRLRDTLRKRGYLGENGYPRISWMTDDLFERVQARLDARARKGFQRLGGNTPRREFLLRGICTCDYCGAPLYARTEPDSTGRYVCRNVRLHTGICTAAPIRADVLEAAVLGRLRHFVGDVEGWLRERLVAQQEERERHRHAADRARVQLREAEQRIQKAQHRYDRALDADDEDVAAEIERQLVRLGQDRDERAQAVAHADSKVQEWSGEPDLDAARRWLEDVLAQVAGRIARAEGAEVVSAAIRAAVGEIRVGEVLDTDDRRYLYIHIWLQSDDFPKLLLDADPERPSFPALLGAKGLSRGV